MSRSFGENIAILAELDEWQERVPEIKVDYLGPLCHNLGESLEQARWSIVRELVYAGSHSHNIIWLVLRRIEKDYGKEAAQQTMIDLRLDYFGWKIPERRHDSRKTAMEGPTKP